MSLQKDRPEGPRHSLRSLSRERLTDRTVDALREYILSNRLTPGTRLPSETSLAESLGVSRNVLRQAVSSLEALGMLRVTHGSGIFVADLADTDVFRQIAGWIGTSTLTQKDYVEVRSIFERGVYELVIERATEKDLDRLEELARTVAENSDTDHGAHVHDDFHRLLLESTGNQFLVTLGTILYNFFWEVGWQGPRVHKPPEPRATGSHLRIVQLLRRRDPADIPRMIDLHLSPHVGPEDGPD
ncbi:MAG TPA: FadR/GntR family transcriptional regulator [Candidatus Dormibacteraeota bacterium]|jgi:DNA-binding FadR family transcriptional regulator|nr:FadR/GntR family transcriptional regulator [Candidatus Dormibacteraeota bacterium]